jgi:hypothetical protein
MGTSEGRIRKIEELLGVSVRTCGELLIAIDETPESDLPTCPIHGLRKILRLNQTDARL